MPHTNPHQSPPSSTSDEPSGSNRSGPSGHESEEHTEVEEEVADKDVDNAMKAIRVSPFKERMIRSPEEQL
jgi:hypothetical protein